MLELLGLLLGGLFFELVLADRIGLDMSRPGGLTAVSHHIQKLITAAEMYCSSQFPFHPCSNPLPIPDAAFGGVCPDGAGQQQQVGVAQQGRRTTVVLPLILKTLQPAFVISVNNLVRTLRGIAGQTKGLPVALPFGKESQEVAAPSLDGARTPLVDAPEVFC